MWIQIHMIIICLFEFKHTNDDHVDLDALDETYELIYENDDVRIYDTGWGETP